MCQEIKAIAVLFEVSGLLIQRKHGVNPFYIEVFYIAINYFFYKFRMYKHPYYDDNCCPALCYINILI